MKKLASLVLALVMVFSLAIGASAATVTAPDNGRTYNIYQIFVGDLSDETLSNVKWGQNGTGTEGTDVTEEELDALTALNSATEAEKLDKIADYVDMTGDPYAVITGETRVATVPNGYYLIEDVGPTEDGETISQYIVSVVKDMVINPKDSEVTSDKQVKETNDSTGVTTDWQEHASYDVGDDVPFKLTATLPADYYRYETYTLTFHDTLSSGLTLNTNSVKVYIDGNEVADGWQLVENPDDGCSFEVTFADLKGTDAGNSSVITVEYTAKLGENAPQTPAGVPNKMKVEYSNNPNDEGTGSTPEDTVVVFTYDITLNKTFEGNQTNVSAGFTLYKWIESAEADENGEKWVAVGNEVTMTEGTPNTWDKVDEGRYKLVETTVPDGFNKAADVEFTVEATYALSETTGEYVRTGLAVKDANNNVISTGDDATFEANVETAEVKTEIENKQGNTLPSTGGMGTTLFYVFGGILVAAAAVLLVTKKRVAE